MIGVVGLGGVGRGWGWDYKVFTIKGLGLGLFAFIQKILEFFPQMLGGNGGPHFCRVREEGVGVMRRLILHSIERELKRIFRCVRWQRSITLRFFIVSYFFSRFKN